MTSLIYLPSLVEISILTKDDEVEKHYFVICILENTKLDAYSVSRK